MDEKTVTAKNIMEGQLNPGERELITRAILDAPVKPQVALFACVAEPPVQKTHLGGGNMIAGRFRTDRPAWTS